VTEGEPDDVEGGVVERCRVFRVRGAVCRNKDCGMEMYATEETQEWPICLRIECLQRYWGGIVKKNMAVSRVYRLVGFDWEERWFCFLQDKVMQHGEISSTQAKYWLYHFLYEKDHAEGYVYECNECGRQYKPASRKCSNLEHKGYTRVRLAFISDTMHEGELGDEVRQRRSILGGERRALMSAGLDGFTDDSVWGSQVGMSRFEIFRHANRQIEVPVLWRTALAYIASRHSDTWALYFMGRLTGSDVRLILDLSVADFLGEEEDVIADVARWTSIGEDG